MHYHFAHLHELVAVGYEICFFVTRPFLGWNFIFNVSVLFNDFHTKIIERWNSMLHLQTRIRSLGQRTTNTPGLFAKLFSVIISELLRIIMKCVRISQIYFSGFVFKVFGISYCITKTRILRHCLRKPGHSYLIDGFVKAERTQAKFTKAKVTQGLRCLRDSVLRHKSDYA